MKQPIVPQYRSTAVPVLERGKGKGERAVSNRKVRDREVNNRKKKKEQQKCEYRGTRNKGKEPMKSRG